MEARLNEDLHMESVQPETPIVRRGTREVVELTPDVAPVKHLYDKFNQISIERSPQVEESAHSTPQIDNLKPAPSKVSFQDQADY